MAKPELTWLPQASDVAARIKSLEAETSPSWAALAAVSKLQLDFLRTERLDSLLRRHFSQPSPDVTTRPVKLAILASSTSVHLPPAIRVGALRRNIHVTVYEGEYGQYLQELADPNSGLHQFRPDVVLFAFDAHHVVAELDVAADSATADTVLASVHARFAQCWQLARESLGAVVIQQTVLPIHPHLMGSNEQRLFGSPARLVARVNDMLRQEAQASGIHLLAIDELVQRDGLASWHDPVLWHKAKQEITPVATPLYGDFVARILGALQGLSKKCLVLDLDNTLWGGVIGDDGLEGISIGQGSALGEAFLAVQRYAQALAKRGIILAVCSKNDEENALAPFLKHPDMLLKRGDISCFVANWEDKATNLRRIARELNIGIDSLVFLDDNPFERNLVRTELPEVEVPEIPDDEPALMPEILAKAGYFESVAITADDIARTTQYAANAERASLQQAATDLPSYLRSLEMTLVWRPFDQLNLGRIVQLINKTNQFNLTTRRKTEEEVLAIMADPKAIGLQLRLIDRFGDNGIIAIVIGRLTDDDSFHIDTWLMSCRVLGRGVEEATLQLLAGQASDIGAIRLTGDYLPTVKNGMVAQHYPKLGFDPINGPDHGGASYARALPAAIGGDIYMEIVRGD